MDIRGSQFDKRDVRNILSSLGMYQIRRDVRNYVPMEVTDVRYQAASESGLWYPAAKPGDMVAEGALLERSVIIMENSVRRAVPSTPVWCCTRRAVCR